MLKLISMIGSIIDKAQRDHVTAFSAQAAFFTILSVYDRSTKSYKVFSDHTK